jgi:hypothetical protein
MDIKEAIILVEVHRKLLAINKGVYLNRDWAVLKCAELQSKATANQYYHLDTVPLYGDVEDPIIDIDRSGEEIVFTSSNGDSLYLYIKTSNEVHEERFHEEAFPHMRRGFTKKRSLTQQWLLWLMIYSYMAQVYLILAFLMI